MVQTINIICAMVTSQNEITLTIDMDIENLHNIHLGTSFYCIYKY